MDAWRVKLNKLYRIKIETPSGKERIIKARIVEIIDPGFKAQMSDGKVIKVKTANIIEPVKENSK